MKSTSPGALRRALASVSTLRGCAFGRGLPAEGCGEGHQQEPIPHSSTTSSASDRCIHGATSTGNYPSQADVSVGKVFRRQKLFSLREVKAFLDISGDKNAIHTDQADAIRSGFEGPVLPGSLGASLFPAVIGSAFPGAVYACQTLSFKSPAYVGRPVTAELSVTSVKRVRSRWKVEFDTKLLCSTTGGLFICGEATALIPTTSHTAQ